MKRFKKIFVEITNACNLNCSYCTSSNRTTEYITLDSFQHVLNEIKPFSDYIYLHVKGEPFLHPQLNEILNLAYEKQIQVNITTNGTLINKVKDILLEKPRVRQINFSLHSFDLKEGSIHKREAVTNIIAFAKEARDKTNIIIALRLWNLDKNKLNTEQIENNSHIIELLEKEFDIPFSIAERYIPGNSIKLGESLYLNFDNEFEWPSLSNTHSSPTGFCHGMRNQAGILVDGTVVPCCLDSEGIINLGNIYKETFETIINSNRAQNIFDNFSNSKAIEKLCQKCDYKARFTC